MPGDSLRPPTGQNSAIWNVPDIEDGIQLIKNLDPNNENAVELVAGKSCDIMWCCHLYNIHVCELG